MFGQGAESFPFPPELAIVIFGFLDFQTIFRCRQVCQLFHDLIDNTISLQYKIELAAAGMDDGQSSTMSLPTRLELLKVHQEAWQRLAWKKEDTILTLKGNLWELCGGVLGLAPDVPCKTIDFRQLPSLHRGIKERQWSLNMRIEVEDFTMDPHQDLLVAVEAARNTPFFVYWIHLRSLSTGENHPLPSTMGPLVHCPLEHRPYGIASSYDIRIFSGYVGVLFFYDDQSELVIWDWKMGIVKMKLTIGTLHTYCFLDDDLVMVGIDIDGPALRVFNLTETSNQNTPLHEYLCEFRYPAIYRRSRLADMVIHTSTNNTLLDVPFSTSEKTRLLVVSFSFHHTFYPRSRTSFISFIPMSTIVSPINKLAQGDTSRTFTWDQWGPQGTRIISQKQSVWDLWVCDVHGMKFAVVDKSNKMQLYDFNGLSLKRHKVQGNQMDETDEWTTFLTEPTTFSGRKKIFDIPVVTSLPCRITTASLSTVLKGNTIRAILLSSDSLITISPATEHTSTSFSILTF